MKPLKITFKNLNISFMYEIYFEIIYFKNYNYIYVFYNNTNIPKY